MRSFMTRHPIASFLLLFYGLGWACFVPSLLGHRGLFDPAGRHPTGPIQAAPIVFFAIIPFVVTRIVGPGPGRSLSGQVRHVRVGPQWYLSRSSVRRSRCSSPPSS